MSYAFFVQQMTITITLLATDCFVCAQVKVEHPVVFCQILNIFTKSIPSAVFFITFTLSRQKFVKPMIFTTCILPLFVHPTLMTMRTWWKCNHGKYCKHNISCNIIQS